MCIHEHHSLLIEIYLFVLMFCCSIMDVEMLVSLFLCLVVGAVSVVVLLSCSEHMHNKTGGGSILTATLPLCLMCLCRIDLIFFLQTQRLCLWGIYRGQ